MRPPLNAGRPPATPQPPATRAEPELQIPESRLEPLAELLMRSATTGLAVWWGEHPEVPRATIVDVTTDMLVRGLGIAKAGSQPDRA